MEGAPVGSYLGRSENGWMDSEVFYEFVANSFVPYIEKNNIPKPVLLLVDGHSSHVNYHVGKLCNTSGVVLYPLPAHASHIVQPCDVSFFKPLKAAWAKAERKFRQEHWGQFVTKYTFASVFRGPWDATAQRRELIQTAFRATGIFPFTGQYSREKLAPSTVYVVEAQDGREANVPGPSGDAPSASTTTDVSEGLALEKHLRFPVIPKKKSGKRSKENMPKCISSEAYLKVLEDKQAAKEEEEERKRKRSGKLRRKRRQMERKAERRSRRRRM
ncbi:uncharacterized protein LOC129277382 [Lytechinus pictus]|uniref:uncharacterized protein LOC129277382 n=1 Tax=Lytechinus pictus TaxID=7653 RepID=UPI0030B9D1BE